MIKAMDRRVAIVTGTNRGLGKATAQALVDMDYYVIKVERHHDESEPYATDDYKCITVDVSQSTQIDQLGDYLKARYGRCDVLINNAGIMNDNELFMGSVMKTEIDRIKQHYDVNTFGPLKMIQTFSSLMIKNNYGRIVNVSSILGSITSASGGYTSYRMSKNSLNMITALAANELKHSNILINSVCPGWCKTDMGGPKAEKEISEGIKIILWAATLPDGGPTGKFFKDGKEVPW